MELLAQGDTIFDILDGRAHEDARKKLLLAQEEPGRGKGGLGWCLTDAAALLWLFMAIAARSREREPLTRSSWFVSLQKSHLSARCAHPRPSGCSTGGIGLWQCVGASQPCVGWPPPPPQPSWPSAHQLRGWLQMAMPVPRMT